MKKSLRSVISLGSKNSRFPRLFAKFGDYTEPETVRKKKNSDQFVGSLYNFPSPHKTNHLEVKIKHIIKTIYYMNPQHFSQDKPPDISQLIKIVETRSDDALESIGAGFAFPVHKKVRTMEDVQIPLRDEGVEKISLADLLRVTLKSLKDAWEKAIEPRMGVIRRGGLTSDMQKAGTDFFTEADTESEKVIVENFNHVFGNSALQFYGEEATQYTGNIHANITVRIDPIDGTKIFKFGKQDWCIMVGIYQGAPQAQEQLVAGIFSPERKELFYFIKGVGAFTHSLETGETVELQQAQEQNNLRDLIVSFWPHTELSQRGKGNEIMKALDEKGATIEMFTSGTEVLEAFLTGGKRIMIFDGDMDQTDYIPFSMLVAAGFKIYPWGSDKEVRPEDPSLDNKKVVIVPPGLAGIEVRELITKIVSSPNV